MKTGVEYSGDAAVEKLDRYLKAKKLRRTPERYRILEQAMAFPKQFVVDDLVQAMATAAFPVSKSTVYSTVDLLVEAGILRRITAIGNGPARYEKLEDVSHIHLLCEECGKLKLVKDLNFMAYMNARKFAAFTTSYYNLTVYGVCNDCARRLKREKSSNNKIKRTTK